MSAPPPTTDTPLPKPTMILNLAATSLLASTTFYTTLGFTPLPAWSDAGTTALRLPAPHAHIALMLHTPERFRLFMRPANAIAGAREATGALFSIICDSKAVVDGWLDRAVAAGGEKDPWALDGYGAGWGMYSRTWADGDGHVWEVVTFFEGEEEGEE